MINNGKLFKSPDSPLKSANPPAVGSAVSAFAHLGPPRTERERVARERIDAHKYDVEAWEMLATEAQSRPILHSSGLFEQLVSTFPTAGRFWKMYVEAHMNAGNDDAVRHIFSRCLLSCFYLDLWYTYIQYLYIYIYILCSVSARKCYIKFIRKVNEQRGPEGREETRKAFEFMVGHVGMDISSGPLWIEYIQFLKTTPVSNQQEDAQRMLMVRKAYQQAVLAPIHHVEILWKEYEGFENSVSRALAKGLLAEVQPKHFNARAVYRERKKYWNQIDQSLLPVPPTRSPKEEQQNAAWKQLLAFEKNNTQRLEPAFLAKRVVFTYEQCLMYFYHYPDVWYDYAMWYSQTGSNDNAVVVFRRALNALPDTTVLYYAYAEFEEARGSIKDAKKAYERLVSNEKIANSLAYIQFMRFVRRNEGAEAARKVFTEARKTPFCTYHLYVAYATMVFTLDKDMKIAREIFELGLQTYIHEPRYVIEYSDFLCRVNDDRNARALFERALNVLPAEKSVEIWNRFVEFEQTYGDISTMLKVQQRRREALTGDGVQIAHIESPLQQLISRYRFRDLWPSAQFLQVTVQKQEQNSLLGASPSKSITRPDILDSKPPISNENTLGLQSRVEDIMKSLPPQLRAFISSLPPVEGPVPDVDLVISILLQNEIPNPAAAILPNGNIATSGIKRKEVATQDEDESGPSIQATTSSAPKDVFRLRQLQRSRAVNNSINTKSLQQARSSSGGGGSTLSGSVSSE